MPLHEDEDDDDRRRDSDEERPSRRRRRDQDEEYDDRPRRSKGEGSGAGKTILIIAVAGGVLLLACGGLGFVFLLPAVSKVREAAARANESNNMKQIAIGSLNYASVNNKLPPAENELSWRVHILPFIEQQSLANSVDMNQSWNAGRNQSLQNTLIKTYVSPLDEEGTTQTHYRVFTGAGTVFDPVLMKQRAFPLYITDGTAETILLADTAEMVPWPQPKEIPFQPNGPLPELGHPKRPQGLLTFCDASVKPFDKKSMNPGTIKAMVTATGNETVPEW
jgi:hypothetical protein